MVRKFLHAVKLQEKKMSQDSIQLFARIKKSSKYFGQTESGALFKVTLTSGYSELSHSVSGNGNDYRYTDLDFFMIFNGIKIKINPQKG